MNKEILIDAINQKGLRNSIISIYYDIGRVFPFYVQRFPDGRVSEWYKSQYYEVHSVKPSGKNGQYGNAYGYLYRNGQKETTGDSPEQIPNAACGSWVLLDIADTASTINENAQPIKVYRLTDVLDKGKHKGETVADVIKNDWQWIMWAIEKSSMFHFDIDEIAEEHRKYIKILNPEDTMPFGKYKGMTIQTIADSNYSYLRWLEDNSTEYHINFEALKR